jgi:hypothetical protein
MGLVAAGTRSVGKPSVAHLAEHQVAMLSLADTQGGADPGLPCAVVAVSRAQAALYPMEELDVRSFPASLGEVYISFMSGSRLVALRGVAQALAADDIRFCPLDVVQLENRRSARLRTNAPVDLAPERAQSRWQHVITHSIDVSATGLLIARRGHFSIGDVVKFELAVQPEEDPIKGMASVLRDKGDAVALDFRDVAPAQRKRLGDHIIAVKRRELEGEMLAQAALGRLKRPPALRDAPRKAPEEAPAPVRPEPEERGTVVQLASGRRAGQQGRPVPPAPRVMRGR